MTRCMRCLKDKNAPKRGMCGSCYTIARKRSIAYGRWEFALVPAAPARMHITELQAAGMGRPQIRRLAGVNVQTFNWLLRRGANGLLPEQVLQPTASKILAVPIPATAAQVVSSAVGRDIVSALGARRRLRALMAAGWDMVTLADRIGMDPSPLTKLIHRQPRIRAFRHHQVVAVFDRLQLERGPSEAARIYARERGWHLPFQWDEDSIDEPDGRPETGSRRRWRVAS